MHRHTLYACIYPTTHETAKKVGTGGGGVAYMVLYIQTRTYIFLSVYIVYVLGTAGMHQVIDTNGSYEPGPDTPTGFLGLGVQALGLLAQDSRLTFLQGSGV